MKIYKILFALCLCLIGANLSFAQVKFKLTKLADGKSYQVSMIPEVSFQSPFNITSTAQITLKAPRGGFEVDQIFNLQDGVEWEPNSLTKGPQEAPDADYLSFGLLTQGTNKIVYEAGVEIPLFAFTNFFECQGQLALLDNKNDPFAMPNSRQVNIGNQITILGAQGDAYIGNASESVVPCGDNLTSIELIDQAKVNLNVFPNPAVDYLFIDFAWARKGETVQLKVLDLNGKLIKEKTIAINQGNNQAKIDIQSLAQGNYLIELTGATWKITSDQFVKMGL